MAAIGPVAVSQRMPGGDKWYPDINAPVVVKDAAGVCVRLTTLTAGTAGSLVLNDNNNDASGNSIANEFQNIAYNNTQLQPGETIELFWPCATGITVSAVPTGWVGAISFS